MRALVLAPDGALSISERPTPSADDECLIRVTAAGICGTDLELLRGYAGFSGVPGHEFVGVVERTPDSDAEWLGRRVAGEITVGCGQCESCKVAGRGHCDVRTVLGILGRDGAFAEYLSLPARNLHRIPDSIDDVTAVFVEPTAAACRILEQVAIRPGMRVALVGAGRLGLLVAQVLRQQGASVKVIVRSARSRAVAETLGFETATAGELPSAWLRRLDIAVDTTGQPAGFAAAAALVRPRGTLVMKSTFHGEAPIACSPLVVDEITIVGSRCGPFDRAIELLANGQIETKPLLAGIYPLEQYEDAFDAARRGLKVILKPNG
jgi:alcohol dehydrogenase